MSESQRFMEFLFADKRVEHYIEVRFIAPNGGDLPVRQSWHTTIEDALEKALAPPNGYDSYVGVVPRTNMSGTKRDVADPTVLWADIDSYKDEGLTQEEAAAKLRAL